MILADGARPPIDKACGEGLMPDCLRAAEQLGIFLPNDSAHELRGIRFYGNCHSIVADFPNGHGLSLRRTVLQPILAERARQVGVELRWGLPISDITGNTVTAGGREIKARWIVGADGSQSSVRRWAGLQVCTRNSQRFSYRQHYRMTPWSNFVEVYWGDESQFYVSPTGDEEVCVALLTRDPAHRIRESLAQFPELSERLAGAEPTNTERGRAVANCYLKRVTCETVALVGDASGTVDPITGQGLCMAFKQAGALAAALVREDLSHYEREHRRLARRPRFMADFMLLMDRSKFLRDRSLLALARYPHLFANLLAMHVGELNPVRFATTATALGLAVIAS